jgi:tRNA(Ile)-lysidine synthase TilS/MesJ
MFSGGLDSTGVFYNLMQDKKQIHLHHMNLINRENRSKAESIAVKNICDYMKKFGDFKYTESTHEYPSYNGNFMWDSDLYNFMAGTICLSLNEITEVALGMTKSDINTRVNQRAERGSKIFESFGTKAKKTYPLVSMTKMEIYKMLPKDLVDLTWSCRTPVYDGENIKKCKSCKSCKELRFNYSPKQP